MYICTTAQCSYGKLPKTRSKVYTFLNEINQRSTMTEDGRNQ